MSNVEGVEELMRKFAALRTSVQVSTMRGGLTEAAKPVVKQARRTAPVDTGLTKKAIRARTSVIRTKGEASVIVGVLWPAFYSVHWVERGTSNAPPHPWLAPSLRENERLVLDIFSKAMQTRIQRAIQRHG